MKKALRVLFNNLIVVAVLLGPALSFADEVTVYAAASLTNAIDEIAKSYEATHKTKIKASFASSGALAKQIEAGAPADVFIAADSKWMDYLDSKGRIDGTSRLNLLGNTLVLIAPKGKALAVRMEKGFDFPKTYPGKLCTGETASVPVGIYAKEALTNLGWWEALRPRIVGADDVRGALDLVQRGECFGIVYETDARLSDKVAIVGTFPAGAHAPIVYPIALVKQSVAAREFFEYLKASSAVFAKYGFKVLSQ
jgi:molybdate transport system substrate-binding protein